MVAMASSVDGSAESIRSKSRAYKLETDPTDEILFHRANVSQNVSWVFQFFETRLETGSAGSGHQICLYPQNRTDPASCEPPWARVKVEAS